MCPDDDYPIDEYGNYIGDDDFDDDDNADYVFPLCVTKGNKKKGSGKHGSRGKGKANHKRKEPIHFYPDYNNEMDVIDFDSLRDFETYCAEEGIFVDDYAIAALASNRELYCCIDPRWLDYGYKYLYCDYRYANMYYEVCKEEELGL